MSMVIASAPMGDEEFLRAFRSCELPASSFRHGDHLRLAWLQLHRAPADEALECGGWLAPDRAAFILET
jgi:hypothetical protein